MIERTQHQLTTGEDGNAIQRQHYIPSKIHSFAVKLRLDDSGQPTLADIYYQLVQEGLDLVLTGQHVPTFIEIGRPDGSKAVQIKFPFELNDSLVELKKRADGGEFVVQTERTVGALKHPYKQISLISLAVTLMELAMNQRQPQPAVAEFV